MMKMALHDQERQQLETIFKTTPDRRLRPRCPAILMAARGRRHRQMAEDLRISVRTLQRWWPASQGRGLDGLKMHRVPGRRAKIPEAWAPEILGWITQGPAGCGLTGLTGPMQSWQRLSIRAKASTWGRPRCGPSASGMACVPIVRPSSPSRRSRTNKCALVTTSSF
jgi:transposase